MNKVIGRNGEELIPATTTHAGDVLFMELEARNLNKYIFAKNIGISGKEINEIINGKIISKELALKFEKELGIDFDFWLIMNQYETN